MQALGSRTGARLVLRRSSRRSQSLSARDFPSARDKVFSPFLGFQIPHLLEFCFPSESGGFD